MSHVKGKKRLPERDKRMEKTNEKFGLTDTPWTIRKWVKPAGRKKIELVLQCTIAEFMNRAPNKGGRGRKTPGRYIKRLCNRRPQNYDLAEGRCIVWLRQQRNKGLMVSS